MEIGAPWSGGRSHLEETRAPRLAKKSPAFSRDLAHRATALGVALVAVIGSVSLVGPSSALAVQSHALEFSFDGSGSSAGAFSDLGSLAIQQSTGDVFAIDRAAGGVDKFDAAGNPQNFSALGSSTLDVEATCSGFQFPPEAKPGYSGIYHGRDDIAVDNSAGPTAGNIYLATDSVDPGAPAGTIPGICAYNSAGEFLWKDTEFTGDGLSVDAEGHVWLGAYSDAVELGNSGSPPEEVNVIPAFGAERLAVGQSTNVYVDFYNQQIDWYTFSGQEAIVQEGSPTAVAIDPGSQHIYIASPTDFREYTPGEIELVAGAEPKVIPPVQLSKAGEELLVGAEGIAVRAATGQVYVADTSQKKILVFGPAATFAAVATEGGEDIRRTTATVTGHLDPDGGGPISGCYVDYGLTKAYGHSSPCDQSGPFSSPAAVSAKLTGLEPGATYHYKVFAADSAGTNYGTDQTLTTPYVSDLSTGQASNLDRTAATLNGQLDPDGVNSNYYFQWGLTTGYGNVAPSAPPGKAIGSTPGDQAVSTGISGLEPDTTYHYRLIGQNAEGKTIGMDESFQTLPPIKNLSTEPPTDVLPNSVDLTGSLDPDGLPTSFYFEWGKTASYGHVTSAPPGADAGSLPGKTTVNAEIEGLEEYTTYHYRIVASNSFGTTYGNDVEFVSAPPYLPEIRRTQVSAITGTTAELSAEVNPGFGPAAYRFEYGPDQTFASRTELSTPFASDGSFHPVSAGLTELQPATTYFFRAVGINFSGSTHGPTGSFTTAGIPGVDSSSSTDIGPTHATVTAVISPNGSPTTYHFEYGANGSYESTTAEGPAVGADDAGHPASTGLEGLLPATEYHFRVVATNGVGSVTGPDETFTTLSRAATASPPAACKRGFKKRHGKCVKSRGKRHKKRHSGASS